MIFGHTAAFCRLSFIFVIFSSWIFKDFYKAFSVFSCHFARPPSATVCILPLIRVASQPALKEWLVGILRPLRRPGFYSVFCHFHGENKVILKFLLNSKRIVYGHTICDPHQIKKIFSLRFKTVLNKSWYLNTNATQGFRNLCSSRTGEYIICLKIMYITLH